MPPLPRVHNVPSYLSLARSHRAASFDYCLPSSRIAEHPLENRSSSKLLVVAHGRQPRHHVFSDLPKLLPQDAMLVLNTSRVIPARLHMHKRETHGRAQLMLLAPATNPTAAMSAPVTGQVWSAYVGGRRVRVGDVLEKALVGGGMLCAEIMRREAQGATVRLSVEGHGGLGAAPLTRVLDEAGETPLPPYIRRETVDADKEMYQTVYAQQEGSVAVPTAGLHVTDEVLHDLRERGVKVEPVVLHVGAGTFAPVGSETVGGHDMHEEIISVARERLRAIELQVAAGRPVVALGTTSVRTLESLYWFGARLLTEASSSQMERFDIQQWAPYELLDEKGDKGLPEPADAIRAVLAWSNITDLPILGKTRLLIVPGYPFKMYVCIATWEPNHHLPRSHSTNRIMLSCDGMEFHIHRVDALVTNFHQPRSTLLMLVSAFHGGEPEDLFRVYQDALENRYRFLSYGDSSIYASPEFFNETRS